MFTLNNSLMLQRMTTQGRMRQLAVFSPLVLTYIYKANRMLNSTGNLEFYGSGALAQTAWTEKRMCIKTSSYKRPQTRRLVYMYISFWTCTQNSVGQFQICLPDLEAPHLQKALFALSGGTATTVFRRFCCCLPNPGDDFTTACFVPNSVAVGISSSDSSFKHEPSQRRKDIWF